MCSVYEPFDRTFYTRDCAPVNQTYLHGIPIPDTFYSIDMKGEKYHSACPYFSNCALTVDQGVCNALDYRFTFIGLVGVVTAIDTSTAIPTVYVTFNDGRTSYPFLQTELELEQYKSMYGESLFSD